MTIAAIVPAVDVRRILTCRRDAVMTGPAATQHLRVIDCEYRSPYVRRMAIFANIACLDMGNWLASCLDPVVATNAVSCDVHVIEIRWQPCCRGMTVVTSVVAVDMSRMLACCSEPVMA